MYDGVILDLELGAHTRDHRIYFGYDWLTKKLWILHKDFSRARTIIHIESYVRPQSEPTIRSIDRGSYEPRML